MEPTRKTPWPAWAWIVFYFAGSAVVLFEKMKFPLLRPGWGEPLWGPWHAKAMANTIGAPLQYRVLSYLLPELPHRLGLSVFDSYLLVRYLCTVAICALLHRLWRPWLKSEAEAALGLLAFLLLYMMSTLPLPQPAEPINIVFVVGCYVALQRRQLPLLYLLVALGALNKLTVVFVAPVAFFFLVLEGDRRAVKTWLVAGGHAVAIFLVTAGMRLAILELVGTRKYISSLWMIETNLKWMKDSAAGWVFIPLVLLPMALVWATWRRQPTLIRAHSLMLPLFVVAHFCITIMAEFRTQMMTLALTIPALLVLAKPRPAKIEDTEPGEDSVD